MWRLPSRPRIDPSADDEETSHVDPSRAAHDAHQRPPAGTDRRRRAGPSARHRPAGAPVAAGPQSAGRPRYAHRYPGVVRTIRGGASPVMIGRESELRRLAQLASARGPAVAIIAGEPGIGKTRLVDELLATVPAETVVLVGQAEP